MVKRQLEYIRGEERNLNEELRQKMGHDQHRHSFDKHIKELVEKGYVQRTPYGFSRKKVKDLIKKGQKMEQPTRILDSHGRDNFNHALDGYIFLDNDYDNIHTMLLDENIWEGLPESESGIQVMNSIERGFPRCVDLDWRILFKTNEFKCKKCGSRNKFYEHYEHKIDYVT